MPTPQYGNYGPTPQLASTPPFPAADKNLAEQNGVSSLLSKGSAPFSNLAGPVMPTTSISSNLASTSNGNSVNYNPVNQSNSTFPPDQAQSKFPASMNNQTQTLTSQQTLPDDTFFNLFWPNWPASLPSPKIVYSLCDIFFSKKWLCEGIVNRDKFFKGLAFPPHHPNFPHVALLHAMCAIATKFIEPNGKPHPSF